MRNGHAIARPLTFGPDDMSELKEIVLSGKFDPVKLFNAADAQALEDFANTKGLGMIAMYSINRDTPGTSYSTTGTTIPQWTFSKTFSDYGTTHVVTAV